MATGSHTIIATLRYRTSMVSSKQCLSVFVADSISRSIPARCSSYFIIAIIVPISITIVKVLTIFATNMLAAVVLAYLHGSANLKMGSVLVKR